ncbi:hypothetical protein F1C58_16610 (plasmid) [Glaciihabitans sp. INWT7]|uniref:HAD domain-containing protein n=1 Tax=Glaciihabitans sp. INWT7 TaxID=2596912 RepID=UPI001624ED68|nr:HAD domain-containing protein [Glaciihabitans sp. INWT7]QNE48679.1 hypothetical protein F1C58_16610 [Glaciihabitans sp. INWT7]
MNSSAPRARLFLDVDGVLSAPALMWGDTRRLTVTVKLGGGLAVQYLVWHSPSMLAAIDSLREEFDVELVWLTTWLEDGAIGNLVGRVGALSGGRWLNIRRRSGRAGELPLEWKRDQILEDLTVTPGPFIWVDDDQVPMFGAAVAASVDVPSLMIAPNPELGLTRAQVDSIRAFLTDNP